MVGARPLLVREFPGAGQPGTLSGCQMSCGGSRNFAILSRHCWHLARGAGGCGGQIVVFLKSVSGHMPTREGGGSLPLYASCKARLFRLVHCGGAMALCSCNSTRWVPIPRDPLPPAGGLEEDKYIILSIFFFLWGEGRVCHPPRQSPIPVQLNHILRMDANKRPLKYFLIP